MPIKILIVDDNEINRIVLHGIIENFAEDNELKLIIDEAVNGVDALAMHANNSYHLIFMDIMMPIMDGVEASYRLRKKDSKVLIIAVSAIDDNERKKLILSKGAEDYISKPINSDVFCARMNNYLTIVENRITAETNRYNTMSWNLFSHNIFSYRGVFFIRDEDELAQFWEYYLLENTNGNEILIEAVRTLYAIGILGLKQRYSFQIISEISSKFIYLTMVGIGQLDLADIERVLMKTSISIDYKINHEKLSIRIPRDTIIHSVVSNTSTIRIKTVLPFQTGETTLLFQQSSVSDAQELQVYNYFYEYDFQEIKSGIASLNSLMLLVGNGEIEPDEVEEIVDYLERIGNIATRYNESFSIGYALKDLAYEISIHRQEFIDKARHLGILCSAFANDLNSWIRVIFVEGATSVNYMDDMIISNTKMISSFLDHSDSAGSEAVEIDDIFDF